MDTCDAGVWIKTEIRRDYNHNTVNNLHLNAGVCFFHTCRVHTQDVAGRSEAT